MKQYIRLLFYIVDILGLAFIMDFILGTIVEKKLIPNQKDKIMYAYNGGKGEDIAVFGASRAAHHYVPKVFQDSLGVSCFNYGCDGQNIYHQYALFNTLIKHASSKPKLVILELASIDIMDKPGWNLEKLSVLHPYYRLDDSIKEVVELRGRFTTLSLKVSKLYSYNSEIHNLLKPVIGIEESKTSKSGYKPLYKEWGKAIEEDYYEDATVDSLKLLYLNEFINKCKNENIQLLLINSPHYIIYKNNAYWINLAKNVAREHNVQFIDYEQDTYFFHNPHLFNEPFHLNDSGAKVYTNMILPEVQNLLNNI